MTSLPAEMFENIDILIVNEAEAEIQTGLTERVVQPDFLTQLFVGERSEEDFIDLVLPGTE